MGCQKLEEIGGMGEGSFADQSNAKIYEARLCVNAWQGVR